MYTGVPRILNQTFEEKLERPFTDSMAVMDDRNDLPTRFIFETHANTAWYSQFKFMYKLSLWTGESGFILAVEQKGEGFDAVTINEKRLTSGPNGEGGAFFRICRETEPEYFFDKPSNARTVYMKHKF